MLDAYDEICTHVLVGDIIISMAILNTQRDLKNNSNKLLILYFRLHDSLSKVNLI